MLRKISDSEFVNVERQWMRLSEFKENGAEQSRPKFERQLSLTYTLGQ